MLANNRVELFDFHFLRHVALVLGGRVVMTGTGAGDEFDFVTHDETPLNLVAALADVGQDGFDAQLVNNAHALAGNAQLYKTLLRIDPETVGVQVGQETPARPVLGMGHVVAALRTLSRDLAYSGHCSKPRKKSPPSAGGAHFIPD